MRGRMMVWGMTAAWILVSLPAAVGAQTPQPAPAADPCATEEPGKPATVEFVLSTKYKARAEEVTRALNGAGEPVTVRIKFFPFLDPPANIGIGRCVSAGRDRLWHRGHPADPAGHSAPPLGEGRIDRYRRAGVDRRQPR